MLDRPNPAGRPVEGLTLRPGWESFVGAGPLPMRHGLTLGELGRWFIDTFKLDVDYRVIEMEGWQPEAAPGYRLAARRAHLGQSQPQRAQPVDGARLCRHGDARRHDAVRRARHHAAARAVRRARHRRRAGSSRRCARSRRNGCEGCRLRDCWFEPTFHKHVGKLCNGVQIHAEDPAYDHARVPALAAAGARLQGDPPPLSRLRPVARLPLRIRARQARHRRHQRRARCCANGSTIRRRRRAISTR